MKSYLSRSVRISIAAACSLAVAALTTGCGLGVPLSDNMTDGTSVGVSGTVHGGPNPIAFPYLYLYATGNSTGVDQGYGAAGTLLNSTVGDANGNFAFPTGGGTCTAGQYGYIVAQGGASGGNNHNPNYLLMAALGPCSTVTATRTVLINELTTVVAAYTLANFTTVTASGGGTPVAAHYVSHVYTPADNQGTAPSPQFVVNIGAPASNNGATACVAGSSYYTGCAATVTSGLGHAFRNAAAIVDTSNGYVTGGTSTGAIVPLALINTLGNLLQACVNSTGGGTSTGNATTDGSGAAIATLTAGVYSFDTTGSACGQLLGMTAYSSNGANTGVLTAPTNTLSALLALAKRPTGNNNLFASSCASGSTGTTTAANCIYQIASPVAYFQPSITNTQAPDAYVLGIAWPVGSFATAANTTACGGVTPAMNGLLYPFGVATDINDNITILNEDSSTQNCFNLLTIRQDGTSIAGNGFDNTLAKPIWLANDSFGHTIIPFQTATPSASPLAAQPVGIEVFATGSDNAISTTPITIIAGGTAATPGINSTPAATLPHFVAVDSSGDILVPGYATNASGNLGYCTATAVSHTAASYTCGVSKNGAALFTSSINQPAVDINNNAVFTQSSASAAKFTFVAAGFQTFVSSTQATTGYTSGGTSTGADTSGRGWTILEAAAQTNTTAPSAIATPDSVYNFTYNTTTTPATVGTTTLDTPANTVTGQENKVNAGLMDGGNLLWTSSSFGSAGVPGGIRFFDTANNYLSPIMVGCKLDASNACGVVTGAGTSNETGSAAFLYYGSRGLTIDSTGSVWVANGSPGTITETFGLGTPTLPLFIHNGVSQKP